MPYLKGLHPGAVWYKCDLQIHSPRDPQWSGSPHLPGGREDLEKTRHEWARHLVDTAIAKGLRAIAITDHHDFCFVPYVREAITSVANESKRPLLYPGVEVTCNDSSQCLVLFDANTSSSDWERLFGGHLLNISNPDPNDAKNPQANICGKDLDGFLEGIYSDSGLRGKCIVVPHAATKGHKTILRQGFHERFRSLQVDGVYLDGPIGDLEPGDLAKIHGKIQQWGTRRRGVLPTGDNRKSDLSDLGLHGCWIRLGEPTAESLRQALLADEARIKYEQPALPSQRIVALRVESSLTGSDLQLSFNDGFTALIGGRGSGKSAILEYLRFGLGRSAADIEGDEEVRAREKSLTQETLSAGKVVVELERDGVREVWTRTGSRRQCIVVQLPDGSVEELTVASAQQRFRARAFYQKQLSSLASDRSRVAEQITGIAAAETIDRRQEAEQSIAGAQREVRAALQGLLEYWVVESEHKQHLNIVLDLRRRLEAVKQRLASEGLKPEHQKLLDEAPSYNRIQTLLSESRTALVNDFRAVNALLSKIPSVNSDDWNEVNESPEARSFLPDVSKARYKVDEALQQILSAIRSLGESNGTAAKSFGERKAEFDISHGEAVAAQVHLRSLIEESKRLTTELNTAEVAERNSKSRLRGVDEARTRLTEARSNLKIAIGELKEILTAAAGTVAQMSGGTLRATVGEDQCPEQYVTALLELCDGNRIRDLRLKCEERVANGRGPGEWEAIITAFLELLRLRSQGGPVSLEPGNEEYQNLDKALFSPMTPQQINGVYSSLKADKVGNLLAAVPESHIEFEYKDGSRYIQFEQASEGQQAAALLELLLRQEAGTLIVDQPEEDLDNRIIIKIAHLLQTTKHRRQLVFATHNPNFVVNGDADKVVALQPGDIARDGPGASRIAIAVDGAIESRDVCAAITETMEGGKEAFELRGRKYQF